MATLSLAARQELQIEQMIAAPLVDLGNAVDPMSATCNLPDGTG